MRKLLLLIILFTAQITVWGQSRYELSYWFNEKQERYVETITQEAKLQLDVQYIGQGIHTLYMQIEDSCGQVSSPITRTFYYTDSLNCRDILLKYWFDEDANTMQTDNYNSDVIWLDVSKLRDGFHTLYIQAEQDGKTATNIHSFIKVPQKEEDEELTCIVIIDDKVFQTYRIETSSGILNLDIDVTSIPQGLHTLQTYVMTSSGATTNMSSHFFVRTTGDYDIGNLKCYYIVDGDKKNVQTGTYSNGTYRFDVDVTSLNDGLHQLSYMLVGENGICTDARTSFFIKAPIVENGIIQYTYWLNDNGDNKVTEELNAPVNPLKLITLLPVEHVPVRSSQFHFEVKDGKPMLYAKNTLNMRFFDVSTRFTDLSREYIDYNVSQEVKDITPIARDEKSKTFVAPGENEIKWFSFEAQMGDTLAFKSSQATSLQLFSPTGKEIFTAKGAESTQMSGCHTWEDGTHYIAVHDVTGTKQNITLDILHMDKYDIVDQDIRVVGDAGASTITYKGNGLKALCEVRFINAQNDTIVAEYIERTSDAEVGVIADFNTAAHGEYDAFFIFSGYEYKTIKNSVRVEEATDINLDTKVSFASTYLRGNSNTYNVSITNSGNMTAYRTPVHIYVSSKDINSISRIDIRGLDLPGIFDGVEKDSIPESEREWLKDLEEKIADNHYFIDAKVFDETTRDSVYAKSGYFFTDIAPNSSKKISIAVDADETFELWITIPEENAPLSNKPSTYARKAASRSLKESYCCIRERVECVATLVADGIGIANSIVGLTGAPQAAALGVADCVASSVNTIISSAGTIMCGEGDVEKNFWDKVKSVVNGTSITGMVTSCASKVLPWKNFNKLLEAIGDVSGNTSMVFGLGIDQAECIIAFTQKKPNCPRNPGGGGGASSPVTSFDPNDIVGFTAESGSRYVPSDFEHTHYTIRCENDPAFATAAAHTVVVTDTLDSRKLDLTTFAARSVKIGDKVMELNGEKSFVKTLDLRTEIDVIAEVSLDFNEKTGVAVWSIKSLSPTTMEPTDDPMQGVLPVNNGGNGEAEFHFDIKLKPTLADGESVNNTASIIFDNNEPIVTPVWTNIIDNTAPVSSITGIEEISDSTIIVNWEGEDAGSGIYRYQLYVQPGMDAEWRPLLGDTLKTSSKLLYKRNIDFGFCIVATDSAGNLEAKELTREVEFKRIHIAGDADRSGEVNVLDINATLDYIMNGEANGYDIQQMDSNEDGEVNLLDINATLDIILERRRGVATLPYREKHKAAKTLRTPVL